MALYNNHSNLPQMAQSAMSSATNALAHQQHETTTETKQKTTFWADVNKAANPVNAGMNVINGVVNATDKGMKLYENIQTKNAYDNVAKAFAEGGYEAIQNNPDMQDYYHARALGQFVKDRANTRKGYLEMLKKAEETADRMYLNFRAQAIGVGDAYNKGDMDAFSNGMVSLVDSAPLPYRLKPDGNGNFKELFRSDKDGGAWIETGRTINAREAYEQMLGVMRGERMVLRGADMKLTPENRMFNQAAARYMFATMMGNSENRLDPKKQVPLYDRNGNAVGLGVIQNPLDDYKGEGKLYVYGNNGKQLGIFNGYDQAMQHGLSPFAPQKAGGRGRARGAGGTGRSSPGSPFQVTAADEKIFTRVCTSTNEETGEKEVDDGAIADLLEMKRRFGVETHNLARDFKKFRAMALKEGLGVEDATSAAIDIMRGQLESPTQTGQQGSGIGQKQPVQNSQGQPASQTQKSANNGRAEREKRIADSAKAGRENPVEKKSGVQKSQDAALKMFQGLGHFIQDLPNNSGDNEEEEYWD